MTKIVLVSRVGVFSVRVAVAAASLGDVAVNRAAALVKEQFWS